jgi:hypothetical protein
MVKGGMSEIISKARVPRRTKEAVGMADKYEPTQTGVQYWEQVEQEIKARAAAYQKAIEDYKAHGGTAQSIEDNIELELRGSKVIVEMDHDGQITAIQSRVPMGADPGDMVAISNATTAIIGLSKSEEAQRQVRELRAYVENDGYISGLSNMVNRTILTNPVLVALSMIPEDARIKAEE